MLTSFSVRTKRRAASASPPERPARSPGGLRNSEEATGYSVTFDRAEGSIEALIVWLDKHDWRAVI